MVEAKKFRLGDDFYCVNIGKKINSKLRIAIANAEPFEKDFRSVMSDTPSRSYKRYRELSFIANQAIKIKGGKNNTILLDTIDLERLRDFQFKEYSLQKSDKHFKPTPPNFNREIIGLKIKHKLWDYLK